jgi:two-component system phosphate regulon response regulator PhoB
MPTVMVVEENQPRRDVLARRLEGRGYHVLLAHDDRDAMVLAREGAPDVIIMDVDQPGLDGWAARQRVPIITLSVSTPIRFELLFETIDMLLPREIAS